MVFINLQRRYIWYFVHSMLQRFEIWGCYQKYSADTRCIGEGSTLSREHLRTIQFWNTEYAYKGCAVYFSTAKKIPKSKFGASKWLMSESNGSDRFLYFYHESWSASRGNKARYVIAPNRFDNQRLQRNIMSPFSESLISGWDVKIPSLFPTHSSLVFMFEPFCR